MRTSTWIALALCILLGTAVATARQPAEKPLASESTTHSWLPEVCVVALEIAESRSLDSGESAQDAASRWNDFYLQGIEAIGREDLEAAENSFCGALEAARSFGPRDIRYAETLDELGLVSYMDSDEDLAEAMQGAAVAEILLALGPSGEPLTETIGKSCRSSVASYMERLGWIFERQRRAGDIDPLMQQPYRILAEGYVPDDSVLPRLDWLISQYLLIEDFRAAKWLSAFRDGLR